MSEAVSPISESQPPELVRGSGEWRRWLGPALFVLAIIGYLPSLCGDYVWDDDQWLVNNVAVHAWNGLHLIWDPFHQTLQYYPLTFTTLWLEHKAWGLAPAGYHAVNMLTHAGAAWLLWLCLRRLKLRGAWLGALLWAIHPVQVESVAWVAEIKNTLSGLLFFLAAWAYLRFEAFGDPPPHVRRDQPWLWYALAILAFAGALLSKTAVCTLPAGLLLVLWWKRRLTWRSIAALVPLFIIGLGWAKFAAAQEQHVLTVGGALDLQFSFAEKLILCGKNFWFYLRTLAVPYPLMAIYPRWTYDSGNLWNYAGFAGLTALLAFMAWLASRGQRAIPAAVLFFLITLSPALGFIPFFTMHYTFVADHYDYLSCAGILVLAAEGLALLAIRHPPARIAAAVVSLALLGATLFYASLYQTNMQLWSWNVAHNPAAFTAQHNLGIAYLNQGQTDEAMRHIYIALQQAPDDDNIQRSVGRLERDHGHYAEALEHLQRAIALRPRFGLSYKLVGDVYDRQHDIPHALEAYAKANNLDEVDDVDPAYCIAYAEELKKAHQPKEAAKMYERAIDLAPGNLITRYNYGNLLLDLNRPGDAITQYEFILKYQDDAHNGPILHNLAYAYAQTNQREKAIATEAHASAIDAAAGRGNPRTSSTAP